MNKNKLRTLYDNIGLPRIIIFLFLIILCICMPILKLQTTSLLAQAVTRIFMNMVLVLAMVPSIECGIGMNYGLPLGVLCGLFGGMISMELGLSGAACFFLAMALGILLACGVGYGTWMKFMGKVFAVWFIFASLFMILAVVVGYC